MARYALCSVCGRGTRIGRARTCTYCGRYVCRKHRTNGLCPVHINVVSKEHANALLVQDHIHHWIGRITIPILFFTFIMSFGIIGQQSRVLGFVSLGIFLVTLLIFITVSKSTNKKHEEILRKAIHSEISDIETTLCLKCIILLPEGTRKCPQCGTKVSIVPGNPFQETPATFTISAGEYTQPLQQYNQSTPPLVKTEYETLPPPPLKSQQQYKTPPPPGYIPKQHTGNQDLDSLLNEIVEQNLDSKVEVTSFYDEKSNFGLHVCSSCGKRFTITSSTNSCPFCNIPLFNTR